MSRLLDYSPYEERNDALFLEEMRNLTNEHLKGCIEYTKIWHNFKNAESIKELPYLHVGIFKYLRLKTENSNIKHLRILHSSSTSGTASNIILDDESSKMQAISTEKILKDFVGNKKRPLLIIDSAKSLRARGEISARIAAAMSLKPLASDIFFLLENPNDERTLKLDILENLLKENNDLIVYGFSWILWLAWGNYNFPDKIKDLLKNKNICFVHSGGWKKFEDIKISHDDFNKRLTQNLAPESKVIDYYGLVEQIGIIYPMCEYGFRHVPLWADVLVRDPYTLAPLETVTGLLQLMNTLGRGAPYHNVLTEDLGYIVPGACQCGRKGKKFILVGRLPKAEMRGCSNV